MITMVKGGGGTLPAISCEEALADMEAVADLRDALFEMLEICLSDEDLKFATPSNSLYIVACLVRTLTRDIEKSGRR